MPGNARVPMEVVATLLTSYVTVAVVAGMAVLGLRLLAPGPWQPGWPPQRQRAAPWHGLHLLGIAVLWLGLDVVVGLLFGLSAEVQPAAASLAASVANGGVAGGVPTTLVLSERLGEVLAAQTRYARGLMAATLAARVLQAIVVLWFLRSAARAAWYQLGLTTHRWQRDCLLAYLVWLVLTPIVFSVHQLVLLVEPTRPHLIEQLFQGAPGGVDWALVLLLTLVVAPVLEELIFRGILQPWLVRTPGLADNLVLFALVLSIGIGMSSANFQRPLAVLVTIGVGYVGFERLSRPWLRRPGAARAIFASSLMFAAIHYDAWPAPVPLFVLGLGLGFLAYRTQSLIGPMLVHCLFNGVSVLMLLRPLETWWPHFAE